MNELQTIGTFQFENLIKNRVSFSLLNFDTDLTQLFPPFHQSHLEKSEKKLSLQVSSQEVQNHLQDKNQAVILVCPDGRTSAKFCHELSTLGYLNCYYISGGSEALRKDLLR